jgi:MFS family permease
MLNKIPYLKEFSSKSQRFLLTLGFQDFLRWSSFIWIFFSNYIKATGVNYKEYAILVAFWSLSNIIFSLPSGALSDILTRKQSIFIGRSFFVIAILLFLLFPTFIGIALGMICWGISDSFIAAGQDPLTYEYLKENNELGKYSKAFAFLTSVKNLSVAVGALLAGVAANLDLKYVMIGSLFNAVVLLITTFVLPKPKQVEAGEKKESDVWGSIKDGLKIVKESYIIKLLVFFLISTLATYAAISEYYTLTLEKVGFSYSMVGVIIVFESLFYVTSGYIYSHSRLKDLKEKDIMKVSVSILLLGFSSIILGTPFTVVAGFFICRIAFALIENSYMNMVQKHADNKVRATILSFVMLPRNLVNIILSFSVGVLIDRGFYFESFLVPTTVTFAFLFFLVVIGKNRFKKNT